MSKNVRLSILLVVGAVAALLVFAAFSRGDGDDKTAASGGPELVRDDSQRLSDGPDGTFVEFLDFECESCGAVYPSVEELREKYGDRVTFVVRYMPLHGNSVNAAKAAEAAAQQGEFEAMYDRLFETQKEWSHSDDSKEGTFFGYAEELGLDMKRFREDFDHADTLARIEQSAADGRALGVSGTPTFFLNGERLEITSIAELEAALEAAVGG